MRPTRVGAPPPEAEPQSVIDPARPQSCETRGGSVITLVPSAVVKATEARRTSRLALL